MGIREGSRRRNNKIIFITCGVIFLLILLTVQNGPQGKAVQIRVGDDSFQVANMLSRAGIFFTPLAGKEGIVVAYTPVSPLARLHKKTAASYYEIHFAEGKVGHIVWRAQNNQELGDLLFVKVVARR